MSISLKDGLDSIVDPALKEQMKTAFSGFTVAATSSTAAELNTLHSVTAGTVAASKAVVVDANKDVASFRNLTATGLITAGTIKAPKVVTTASGDGAITISEGIVKITKGSAAALTLADPASGDEGKVITIVSTTAYAHTISNTGGSGFNAGGASKIKASYTGVGDTMAVVALGTKWYVLFSTPTTVTFGVA